MARPSSSAHARLRASSSVLPLVALLTLLLPAPATTGAVPFTFSFIIGSSCVSGTGPANKSISLRLQDADGVVLDTKTTTSNGSGGWSMSSCFDTSVVAGYKVRAKVVGESTQRTFSTPTLNVHADRATDVASGRGPANSQVMINLFTCPTMTGCNFVTGRTRPTDAKGAFTTDFTSAYDAKGRDYVYVWWNSPSGDTVSRSRNFPYVNYEWKESNFYGYANPDQLVTVTLRSSAGKVKAAGRDIASVVNSAYFSGYLTNASETEVGPRQGDKLSSSLSSGTLTVPDMSVTGTPSTDLVTGDCLPIRPFEVYAHDPDYQRAQPYSYAYGTAGASGHIATDMSNASYPTFNLLAGDIVQITCLTGAGDTLMIDGHAP